MENRMTGHRGVVQSVLKRGADAYQVTLSFYPRTGESGAEPALSAGQLLVYRADIAIEDDRTILFPDRELAKCMDAYNAASETAPVAGSDEEWLVGRIALRICRGIGHLLVERNGRLPSRPLSFDSDGQIIYRLQENVIWTTIRE